MTWLWLAAVLLTLAGIAGVTVHDRLQLRREVREMWDHIDIMLNYHRKD